MRKMTKTEKQLRELCKHMSRSWCNGVFPDAIEGDTSKERLHNWNLKHKEKLKWY